jgi:hypothetical protein
MLAPVFPGFGVSSVALAAVVLGCGRNGEGSTPVGETFRAPIGVDPVDVAAKDSVDRKLHRLQLSRAIRTTLEMKKNQPVFFCITRLLLTRYLETRPGS